MSQSPIRLQSVVKKTGVVDGLPLIQPKRLFECRYKPREQVSGCFEGEAGHGNFVLQGKGPLIRFRGAEYELRKIHLHRGSEHIVEQDDKHDLELHFVHTPAGSSVASPFVVVGVLFRKATSNSRKTSIERAIDKLLESAQSQACVTIKPLDLFPKLKSGRPDTVNWFHYEGSLTSFPYSENVSWIVMNVTAEINPATVKALEECAEQEQREIQPLDRRIVVRSFLLDKE